MIPKPRRFSFSAALNKLKKGEKLQRKGWNGKNMYIILAKDWYCFETALNDENAKYSSFIAMRTAQGDWVPWLASQTDILATDWQLFKT